MATTTKTLTPTNQVVTLPDMTERPNASVMVDGISKEADAINKMNNDMLPLAPAYSKTQINFNAQQVHTIDLGVTPTSDKNASVLLMVANQGILSEISCTGSGAVKTDFGTALTSVSLSGSTLTINFASRPWGLCVALIHHN